MPASVAPPAPGPYGYPHPPVFYPIAQWPQQGVQHNDPDSAEMELALDESRKQFLEDARKGRARARSDLPTNALEEQAHLEQALWESSAGLRVSAVAPAAASVATNRRQKLQPLAPSRQRVPEPANGSLDIRSGTGPSTRPRVNTHGRISIATDIDAIINPPASASSVLTNSPVQQRLRDPHADRHATAPLSALACEAAGPESNAVKRKFSGPPLPARERIVSPALSQMVTTAPAQPLPGMGAMPPAGSAPPEFYSQAVAEKFAADVGFPNYHPCGSLALAHMTGTPPLIAELYELALARSLNAGKSMAAAAREIRKGVYIEQLGELLDQQDVSHQIVELMPPEISAGQHSVAWQMERFFDAAACTGVTYGYQLENGSGAFHYAALKKVGDDWWELDSMKNGPLRLAVAPQEFLQKIALKEATERQSFRMITVAQA